MPSRALIDEHRKVQNVARAALSTLAATIGPHDTEQSIATAAVESMRRQDIHETWYYDCPALVLVGSRTCASPSGREYQPSVESVGQFNLVTVDLSPSRSGYWGDCARSFFVEGGSVTAHPVHAEFAAGAEFQKRLHSEMREFVRPQTTFHDLAIWTAQRIEGAGFINLDFRGNVGHSIATRRADRKYIEAGNHEPLGDAAFFTFEPHLRASAGSWGFKHEDIFYFGPNGELELL